MEQQEPENEENSQTPKSKMSQNIRKLLKVISPCIILLLGHGTHFVWALNRFKMNIYNTSQVESLLFDIYYFGGIIGAILGAGLVCTVRKRVIYNIAAILTLIVGALFAASGIYTSLPLMIFGRLIAGSCHAMMLLTALIHASEIASHEYDRHKVITILGICLGLSFVLPALILIPRSDEYFETPANDRFSETYVNDKNSRFVVGVICLIQAVSVFLTNLYNIKESPYFLLQKRNADMEEASNEAFNTFKLFQNKLTTNADISTRFSQLKSYVIEEKGVSRNIFNSDICKALLLCTMTRLISLLTFNFGSVYFIILVQYTVVFKTMDLGTMVFGLSYFIFGLITTLAFYKYRHILYIIAAGVNFCLLAAAVLAVLIEKFSYQMLLVGPYVFWTVVPALHIYCFSLPLEICAMINLSEAFPLPRKAYSISFVLVIEYSIHLLISRMEKVDTTLGMISVFGILLLSVIVAFKVPRNTNKLILEKCPAVYKAA